MLESLGEFGKIPPRAMVRPSLALGGASVRPLAIAGPSGPGSLPVAVPGGCPDAVADATASPEESRSGAGLNPWFVYLNMRRRDYRASLAPGKKMTAEQQTELNALARKDFDEMSEECLDAVISLYEGGVDDRRKGIVRKVQAVAEVQQYVSPFGIGDVKTPIRPEKFCEAFAHSHATADF
jgi:hypothetical protein